MSYVINNSRGNIVAVVPDGTINTTSTSVNLVGRGVTPYGLPENENYVYLLENFASPTPPLAPVLGQLWYDSSTNIISLELLYQSCPSTGASGAVGLAKFSRRKT